MQDSAQQDLGDRLLTVGEVSRILHLSEYTVRKRLRRGLLPGLRLGALGSEWRVSERELQQWLAARRGGPATGPMGSSRATRTDEE